MCVSIYAPFKTFLAPISIQQVTAQLRTETHVDFYVVLVIVVRVEIKLEQADGYYYWQGMSGFLKICPAVPVQVYKRRLSDMRVENMRDFVGVTCGSGEKT